ncbi:U3 small nucleolar RNA-associated protein [Gaertneriomyces sp. JEL0708]|nr:U3 small nucleolar RNA-associated protein [Gaertneriomyces sp. JEL0708]
MDNDPPPPTPSGRQIYRRLQQQYQAQQRTLQVHRCKVVKYTPSEIVSLAFTPGASTQWGRKRVLLACARANGNIEIWNPRGQGWFCERIIPGSADAPIEKVLWIHQTDISAEEAVEAGLDTPEERATYVQSLRNAAPRLLTVGLDGCIAEWDTVSQKPRRIAEPGGGAIWCAAVNPSHTRLAVGSEDGHVRIFNIADGQLEFLRVLEKAPTRIMSIAWHYNGSFLVTGGADSSIRKMDVKTGRTIGRMTTATVDDVETLIWDLTVLKDSTIVTGDSMGHVSFWDWKTGTLKQSIKAHDADVLCLTAHSSGSKVWTSGVDRKVVQVSFIASAVHAGDRAKSKPQKKGVNPTGKRWVVSGSKRYHSHDVRALAVLEERPFDVLASGGIDRTLVLSSPLKEFPFLKQYRQPNFPQRSIVQITRQSRLLLARFQDHIKVWQLGRAMPVEKDPRYLRDHEKIDYQRETLMLNIKPKCATNLSASAISEDGRWIAISDMQSVRLFRVEGRGMDQLRVRKMKSFPSPTSLPAAHVLCFTPDSLRLIVAGCDSVIYVVDLSRGLDNVFEVIKKFGVHRGDEDEDLSTASAAEIEAMDVDTAHSTGKTLLGGARETISSLTVSGDGQWLASGDLLNRIHIFNLDALHHHSTLPTFSSLHTTISFHPTSPVLLITTTSNRFYLYDVEDSRLTDWSKEYSERLPLRWLGRKECVMGVGYDPRQPGVLTMWAEKHVTWVDLEKPIGSRDAVISVEGKKLIAHRKRIQAKRNAGKQVSETEEMDGEAEELERKAAERRRKNAQMDIVKATNGVNGVNGHAKGNGTATEGEDEHEVILIESDSEDDELDMHPLASNVTSSETGAVNGIHAGTKRSLETDFTPFNNNAPTALLGQYNPLTATPSDAFSMTYRYGPIMGLGYIGEDELIVVERPVLDVLKDVGGAYYKKKYGT